MQTDAFVGKKEVANTYGVWVTRWYRAHTPHFSSCHTCDTPVPVYCPTTGWGPEQGVPRLHPQQLPNKLQQPRDPKGGVAGRKWVDTCTDLALEEFSWEGVGNLGGAAITHYILIFFDILIFFKTFTIEAQTLTVNKNLKKKNSQITSIKSNCDQLPAWGRVCSICPCWIF